MQEKRKGFEMQRNSAEATTNAYTYNKRKEYYGSTSKLPNDTYESVCPPEDTEERNQAAQRNSNAMMNQVATNNINNNHNNNSRLLKRVVSAPVGIETPKGELLELFRTSFTFNRLSTQRNKANPEQNYMMTFFTISYSLRRLRYNM